MGDGTTDIAGIGIPSTNPVFLTVVGIHVLLGPRLRDRRRHCDAEPET